MATKIKKIYKGIKYITHIFVVKEEREIEIGLPTDVKHIAHIGSDGASGHPPSWMNEFKTKPKEPVLANTIAIAISNAKIEEIKESNSTTWSSEEYESPKRLDRQPVEEMFDVTPTRDIPKKKKKKRKKTKSKSMSMISTNPNTTTRRVAPKSKTKLVIEGNARPESIQVM